MSRTYLCIQLMITKTKTTKGQIGILVRDKACSLTELTEFSTSPKHNARNSFIKLNFSCVFSKEVNIRSSYCFSLTVHLQEGINKKKNIPLPCLHLHGFSRNWKCNDMNRHVQYITVYERPGSPSTTAARCPW